MWDVLVFTWEVSSFVEMTLDVFLLNWVLFYKDMKVLIVEDFM